jgi:hypothetical protein
MVEGVAAAPWQLGDAGDDAEHEASPATGTATTEQGAMAAACICEKQRAMNSTCSSSTGTGSSSTSQGRWSIDERAAHHSSSGGRGC